MKNSKKNVYTKYCKQVNLQTYLQGSKVFLWRGLWLSKGQINQKADWRAVDSPKKRTDEFDSFVLKSKQASKKKLSVGVLGEVSRP